MEKLSVHHSQVGARDRELKKATGVSAAVILSTCNRLEYYATCCDADEGIAAVIEYLMGRFRTCENPDNLSLDDFVYTYADDLATRHLFEVVSGIDSLIVGEAEIMGQVNRAYKAAFEYGTTDKLINVWFQRALHVGKMVRSETTLGAYSLSIGRIAVEMAEKEVDDINNTAVLILGAGEICELTMKYLMAYHFPVVMVTNRSYDHAKELAEEHGFEALPITSLEDCLKKSDIVFSATSAKHFMIDRPMVERAMAARNNKPMVFIDMAVPRDIDPSISGMENVSLHNINEMRTVSDRNRDKRALAASNARGYIRNEVEDFHQWVESLELVPTITALRAYADDVRDERLAEAMGRLKSLSPSQKHAVEVLATTLTDALIKAPVEKMHEVAGTSKAYEYAIALQEMYDLDVSAAYGDECPTCITREREAV